MDSVGGATLQKDCAEVWTVWLYQFEGRHRENSMLNLDLDIPTPDLTSTTLQPQRLLGLWLERAEAKIMARVGLCWIRHRLKSVV